MKVLTFDTALLPPAARLPAFRQGAVDFRVDAIGDPLAFATRWQLLKLGDLNAIRSSITPVSYCRDRAMIEADGEDRVAVHFYAGGVSAGRLDDRPAEVRPGGAMVWDLTRPLDLRSTEPIEVLIITVPRYMLDEIFAVPVYSCVLPPSAGLTLAADQLRHMLDHSADLPDDGAAFFGRALRDLFAAAMLPTLRHLVPGTADGPLYRRICRTIDTALDREIGTDELAGTLAVPADDIRRAADRFGGLAELIERRRLLAAYRLLCNPDEAEPVSAIAWRCGFADLARFSRRFREVFHASPTDLRQFRAGGLPAWAGAYHVEDNYMRLLADGLAGRSAAT